MPNNQTQPQLVMETEAKCPECGRPLARNAARGLCPRCLFELGQAHDASLDTPTAVAAPASAADGALMDHGAPGADDQSAFRNPQSAIGLGRFGDYELLEEIARGGMGVVYRARQVSLDRIVAVKMLLFGPLASPQTIQRFRTEAAAAGSLQHPNIVAVHEVGLHDGQHFFAMEYVAGRSLAAIVKDGPLLPKRAATYLKTIAEAIHYAHERGILHRDLKPSNVLIDPFDQPKVTDFGLAKRLETEIELTLSGQLLGSPNYMPPEQAAAKRGAVGKRSDVYALGAILYHLLTGRPPFVAPTVAETLHEVLITEPVSPRVLNPGVPPDLETICLKCLEKEPARRYQTAQELADELSLFLRDEPIKARSVSRFEKAWRWCRREPALASLGASLVLVFTLGFAGTLWQWRQAMHHAEAETKQRQLAEQNRERADQNTYDSDMSLAQHEWDAGDLGRTLSLLEAHRPQPGEKTDRRGFEWFYFWNLCQGDQRMTLTHHSQAVTSLAFSPDGKRLATGSVGDPVRICDTASGRIVKTLPEQNVVSLAFAPDGQTLGVGGRDKVVVWNLETGRAVFKREEALGQFRIAFSPVGTLLVIGKRGGQLYFDGGSVELWDYVSGELKQHVFPESGGHIALSQRGDRLATGNWNQTTKIWDLASGQFVRSLKTDGVMAMALSPDSQTLATIYWGPEVKLWDVTTGLQIGSLTNNQHRVWSLAFSPDGRFLATGDGDQKVRLWDVATLQQVEQLVGHGSEVMSVAFSADGQTLASGSKDKKAMLWSVHPNRAMSTVSNVISRPIFSPDGRFVAAGIGRNIVAACDVATLQIKAVFADAHDAVAFSADGSALVTRGTNYFLKTFDVATQAVRETISREPVEETDSYAALSPDGLILAVGLTNGTLTFSDAKTGAVMATNARAFGSNIFQLAFSPNGKLLATAGREDEAEWERPAPKIWVTVTHKMVAAPLGHTDRILSVAFSPDGKTLVTCGADNSIRFWDTTTWKEISPSLGTKEAVTSVAFSPNGRTLATASADGTMKLWNVATRRELASLKLGLYARCITFSPDGQTLAAWDPNGLLRLWRAPVPDKKQPARGTIDAGGVASAKSNKSP